MDGHRLQSPRFSREIQNFHLAEHCISEKMEEGRHAFYKDDVGNGYTAWSLVHAMSGSIRQFMDFSFGRLLQSQIAIIPLLPKPKA